MSESISLEDLVALNDEIASLVRAGVPLDLGLASWGGDLPGRLGRIVTQLGKAAEQGQNLGDSLAAHTADIPPIYRAVVAAGIKSGRLPAALESLASTARKLKEIRSAVGLAVLYPLFVVLLAYGLFIFLATHLIPALSAVFEAPPPRFWTLIGRIGSLASIEIPIPGGSIPLALIPPLVLLAAAALWWFKTRRALVVDGGGASRWLSCVPFAPRVLRHARAASLAEILGLLVENGVPLHDAIELAAECTADRRLIRAAHQLAATAEQGGLPNAPAASAHGFPPLLAWLVSAGGRQDTFVAIARHVADTYRRRIARDAQWLHDYLPLWLTVGVGGICVALYCITVFGPYGQLMNSLSGITGQSLRIKP